MAWKQGRTRAGDESVEGSKRRPATAGCRGEAATEKSALEVLGAARLDSQAMGYTWAGSPVARPNAKIQRCLEGWQLNPLGRHLWEAPPLQELRQQPEGHGQCDLLWTVQGRKGENGKI